MKSLRLLTLSLLVLLIALPSQADRKRPVRPPAASAATLSGTVVNDAGGGALEGATVTISGASATTDAQGKFSLAGLRAGSAKLITSRFGYGIDTRTITLTPGANSLTIRLRQSGATVITTTDGATHQVDGASTEFGYVVTFVGYTKYPHLNVCRTGSEQIRIDRGDIKAIIGPAVAAGANDCCGRNGGQKLRILLRSGEEFDAVLYDTCRGYTLDVITILRSDSTPLYVPLSRVSRIEFP